MQREGYGAVNSRSVAAEAEMKPPLVHYHFETTDNLLLEAYRRSVARSEAMLRDALASDRPLTALWKFNSDPIRTALATQFMALAMQHPSVREDMARNVTHFRDLQAEMLEPLLTRHFPDKAGLTAPVLSLLLAAIGRAVVMEGSIGISAGHAGLSALVEQMLATLEPA